MSDLVKLEVVRGYEGKSIYINDYRVAGSKPYGGGRVEHAYNVKKSEILKALNIPPVEAPTWIPCSERLPEEPGFYVVTKRQKSGEIKVALGSYRPFFNEWSGNGNFKDVIAWMQMPQPYKEK